MTHVEKKTATIGYAFLMSTSLKFEVLIIQNNFYSQRLRINEVRLYSVTIAEDFQNVKPMHILYFSNFVHL